VRPRRRARVAGRGVPGAEHRTISDAPVPADLAAADGSVVNRVD
jgi:hypothetical protein